VVLACASLVGCASAPSCPILLTALEHHRRVFSHHCCGLGYASFSAASDPAIVLSVGFVLIVAIYVQTAILFGVYTPELFPTEIRLRANGICNTLGRAATVVSPFVVGYLMVNYQLPG
jgi:putative MFS transporter